VVISLESIVGSCWGFDILFLSHSTTNWPEGLEGTQFDWQISSSEISWKTKGNTPARQFWSSTDFSLFHHWIMLILVYMVRLDVAFILDSGDRKHILGKGFVHIE
jgi:hypothetical protein